MYRGSEVLNISDDSEDPRFYARDVPEDSRDEQGKDEFPEPDYFAGMVLAARTQAAGVLNQQKREDLLACLDAAERIYGERNL